MKHVGFLLALLVSCSVELPVDKKKVVAPEIKIFPEEDGSFLDATGSYPIIVSKEGKQYHTGYIPEPEHLKKVGKVHVKYSSGCENLPESFDLRELPVPTVPPIKNQGSCGSCWAFSKTGSLESAMLAAGNKYMALSEQQLNSCDTEQGGCNGGNLSGFRYQLKYGQTSAELYPYTSGSGGTGRCKSGLTAVAKPTSFAYIGSPDNGPSEAELKCGLMQNHTVPWITVSASGAWGSPPKDEMTAYSRCGRGQTNHAVGVTGWHKDSKSGKTVFHMRNSWGTNWGANGFMSLPLGCDRFGTEEVAFLVAETAVCKPATVLLPAEVSAQKGVEVMLGVKADAKVEYVWSKDGKEVGKGSTLYVTVTEEAIYKLTGKNSCSTAESSVRVKVAQ